MKVPCFISALLRISFVWLLFFTQTNSAYSQGWNIVGQPGFSATTASFTSLAFNGSTPYVAYQDGAVAGKLTVKKFDGANWVTVGTAGFSAGIAGYISLAFDGSIPYVAYRDGGNNNKATVMKFDGANWVTVGTAGFSAGTAAFTSIAFDGSTPYVAYEDASNNNKATVMKFDGANWVTVGSAGFSAFLVTYTSLAFDGSTPYVAYTDNDLNNRVTVKKFDGANWVTVGLAGFSAGAATYISFVFNGSTPYVAYTDAGNSSKATVKKFDGATWVTVGTAGFSVGSVLNNSLAFNGSTPYLAYRDVGNSSKVTVTKFDITPATGLYFDGVNDYVNVPDNPTLDFGDGNFTVECWTMKLAASSSYLNSSVAGKWNTGSAAGTNEWLLQNTLNGSDNLPAFLMESGSTTYTVSGPTPMTLTTWYHLAAVRDGDALKLYVNGVLEGTITLPANTTVNNVGQNLHLAAFGFTNGPVKYSRINLDELRIWKRALCQREIQNNMNCGLNATGQTGLQALYGFNQGSAGDNNSAITTLTDGSSNGNYGTLTNFALSGTTSNWLNGKVSSTCSVYTPSLMAATAGGSQVCQSATVQTPGTIYQDASCNLIAKLSPSGATPVSGTVNTCVIIDNAVQTYNSQPYVQRHYDIEPATGAATATGTITLTFTQAEFDNYNAARGSLPALPTGAADAAGINNLVVTQYHGTGTAPGNYGGGTVLIDPANANIAWNATQSRWEVTFDVTGFSGFYVQTTSSPLPVKLLSFTASKTAGINLLKWTSTEEINTDNFEVERNTGNGFNKIGIVKAADNSDLEKQYTFEDKQPFAGTNHYRLKMVDKDGHTEYSKMVTLQSDGRTGITMYPNPAQSKLFVEGAINGTMYQIKNTSGQVVTTGRLNTEGINLSTLSTGIYVLVVNGAPFKFVKQ